MTRVPWDTIMDRLRMGFGLPGSMAPLLAARAQESATELAGQMAATEHFAGLGRMAAGIAHEIRSPMAAMRSN